MASLTPASGIAGKPPAALPHVYVEEKPQESTPAAASSEGMRTPTARELEHTLTTGLSAMRLQGEFSPPKTEKGNVEEKPPTPPSLFQRMQGMQLNVPPSVVPAAASSASQQANDSEKILQSLLEQEEPISQADLDTFAKQMGVFLKDVKGTLTPAAANNAPIQSADPNKILADALKELGTTGVDLNSVETALAATQQNEMLNKSMEKCTQFFQDFLNQPRGSHAAWLKAQSENVYQNYQINGIPNSISPFYHSRMQKLLLEEHPTEQAHLNETILSNWTATYTACISKLKSLKLEAYLDEFPKQMMVMEEPASYFMEYIKNMPQSKQEVALWLDQWTDEPKMAFFSLEMFFPFVPEHAIPKTLQALRAPYLDFRKKLHTMGLLDHLAETCTQSFMRALANPEMVKMMSGGPLSAPSTK